MYGGVWPSASTPSIADIKAGTGAVAGTASSQAVSSGALTFPVTGLTADTDYKFHFVQTAAAGDSNQVENSFTTLAFPAPVITANATTAITQTTATGNVSTDTQSGTMYGGVWPAASTPNIASIKAGTGAVAGTASSQAVSAGALTFPVTGLTANTNYKFHFVQEDVLDSNQAENAFSTLAVPTTKSVQARFADLAGTDRANLTNLSWSWFDAAPATGVSPTDTGTGEITDASGNFVVAIPNTTLNAGQVGYLVVVNQASGWQGIYPLTVVEL